MKTPSFVPVVVTSYYGKSRWCITKEAIWADNHPGNGEADVLPIKDVIDALQALGLVVTIQDQFNPSFSTASTIPAPSDDNKDKDSWTVERDELIARLLKAEAECLRLRNLYECSYDNRQFIK